MSVVVDISVSLDGFVTAAGVGPEHGLGVGGEALHEWAFCDHGDDRRVLETGTRRTGAVVIGRRLFDLVDPVWDLETGYGAGLAAQPPCFVVTHARPDQVRLVDRFTFVTDGLEAALEQAAAAAGDLDVVVMGGGDVCGQVLAAGLVDELSLHVAPVVLGGGTPLFPDGVRLDLTLLSAVSTPHAQHLAYAFR